MTKSYYFVILLASKQKGFKMSSTFNLKEVFNKGYGWDKGFEFEIVLSRTGVARIYVGDRMTSYKAGGYGYCKESSVIARMINDLIGVQQYDSNIYGNRDGFLSDGTGFDSIKRSFESVDGYKLEKLYSGLNSKVYSISFK